MGAVLSPAVENLVAQLTRLPGVGQRTAQRLAFHLLQVPKDEALALASALEEVKERVRFCRECGNLTEEEPAPAEAPPPQPPSLELEQLQEAWQRTILPAVEQRSIPIAAALGEAHPSELSGSTLTVEFPPNAQFHLTLAEDPKNQAILQEALYEVTGRKLALAYELGEEAHEESVEAEPQITSEEDFVSLLKDTFDAREVDD